MSKQLFVNLPVKDLKKSRVFFESMGYSFNPQFSNDEAACLMLGENLFAMLVTEKRFLDFTKKPISDAANSTEVILALDCDSRQEVDELLDKAIAAGGKIYRDPDDHGFMYSRSFADPDGHQWEFFFMDLEAFKQAPAEVHQSA